MIGEGDILDGFVSTLRCASEDHYPMSIRREESEEGVAIYGIVHTVSGEVDGCGGRTDLHDMLAALWAVVLRANGVASSRLVDVEGFVGSPELSARWLIFEQPSGGVFPKDTQDRDYKRLLAHTAWAFHGISEAIRMERPNVRKPSWQEDNPPSWVPSIRALMGMKSDELYVTRENPNWQYYTANKNALSVIKLEPERALALRLAMVGYKPKTIRIGRNHILRVGRLVNAVSSGLLSQGNRLLKCVEGHDGLPWRGLATNGDDGAVLAIPLETHCAFLGSRTVVVLRRDCSYRRFLRVRDSWKRQSSVTSRFLNLDGNYTSSEPIEVPSDVNYTWSEPSDASRLEELVKALLQEEPGFEWVRLSGHTFEGDSGRDMIANWVTAPGQGQSVTHEQSGRAWRLRKLVVQVKARRRTVGKSDVRDVRDTLERHQSDGFFLAAVPRLSTGLIAYLETLREQGYWVDWWSRVEIEDRLRGSPNVASRFGDVVRPGEGG